MINLNIDVKTNGTDVNNILTEFIFYFQQQAINYRKNH